MTGTEFTAAIDRFEVADLAMDVDSATDERLREAAGAGGVILIGEIHGMLENPLAARLVSR